MSLSALAKYFLRDKIMKQVIETQPQPNRKYADITKGKEWSSTKSQRRDQEEKEMSTTSIGIKRFIGERGTLYFISTTIF